MVRGSAQTALTFLTFLSGKQKRELTPEESDDGRRDLNLWRFTGVLSRKW